MNKKRFIVGICIVAPLALFFASIWWTFWRPSQQQAGQTATTSGQTANKDDSSPTIKLDTGSTAQGKELSGVVIITVDAQDNVSVSKVDYYMDGVFFAVTYAPPFSLTLDTSTLTPGKHSLLAKAYDGAGNQATSQEIIFTVAAAAGQTAQPARKTSYSTRSSSSSSGGSTSSATGSGSAPDSSAPSAPSNLVLTADGPYVVHITWNASSDNVGVSNYKVFRDGSLVGTTTSANYTDYTVVPGNTYAYSVIASDVAGNATASSSQPGITLASTNIWMNFDTPGAFGNDGSPLELGVKFRPLVNGRVTGIRFYKAAGDTATHTGRLWSSTGTSLATAIFSGEGASGWQQVTFSSPIDVTAGTTYVASYTTPDGKYGSTSDYFASQGITSQYLTALASGVDGNNGVFNTTGGSFPASSFSNTNYWVDVSFIPNAGAGGPGVTLANASQIYNGFPGSDNTGVVGKRLPMRDRAPDITTAGMMIENVQINTPNVYVSVDNVTFRNVKIVYSGALDADFTIINIPPGTTGTIFQDSEIDGQNKVERAIKGIDGITVTRCNIHNAGNAVEVANQFTVEDSYLHDIFTPTGLAWHADGVQSASAGSNYTVRHNTILLTGGETGAVNIQGNGGDTFTNVLIENNLMAGGGYTVYAGAGTNVNYKVINNKLSTMYNPTVGTFNIYYPNWLTGVTVSGNTIYETGAAADVNF